MAKRIPVVAAVVERDGRVLVARRRQEDRFGGLWEFPGGKVEPGESPAEALARELREELRLDVTVGDPVGEFPYESGEFSIVLLVFRANPAPGQDPRPDDHEELRWADPGELASLEFAKPDRPVVKRLLESAGGSNAASRFGRVDEPDDAVRAPRKRDDRRGLSGRAGGGEALVLQPTKDKAVRNRHHWVFSGAIRSMPDVEPGTILPVRSFEGDHLGYAYVNPRSSITARMLSFDRTPGEDAVRAGLRKAVELRRTFFDESRTNAYRVVNAEGDALPGLVVDRYADALVLQSATAGMDRLKPLVAEVLDEAFHPRSVIERSDVSSRREEGLDDARAVLRGELVERVDVLEDGLRFRVDVLSGQKTGFFLDQRGNRALVRELAAGRSLLNAFSYTGAFSIAALKGGAARADAVDASEPALALARENLALNGLPEEGARFIAADVFSFLRGTGLDYDFVILDPPAFAKRRADVVAGCRGYKDINRLAMKIVRPGGLVLTFSCSHFVDEGLFRKVVFEAAAEAGRAVRILQRSRQAFDHPVNVYHPETEYLKGFLLYVD